MNDKQATPHGPGGSAGDGAVNGPLDGQPSLAAALRQVAADLQLQAPPAALQARVMAAARMATQGALPAAAATAGAGKPRRSAWAWSAWSGAAACATVLVGSTVLMLRLPPPLPAQAQQGLRASGFVPLVPAERWPDDAATGWIVSTELQGDRLAALGLPFDPARAADSVRAELLLRPSGEVLAVRFIR